jgi:hypothetical protein
MTSLMQSVKRQSDIARAGVANAVSSRKIERGLELPGVAANDRRRRPSAVEAVDVDVLSSDHEVRMDCRHVDAGIEELVRRDLAAERLREPCSKAIWHVAFSSKSVSLNTRPVCFTGDEPSTRASSPR